MSDYFARARLRPQSRPFSGFGLVRRREFESNSAVMNRGAVFVVFVIGTSVVHASPCHAAEADHGAEVAAQVGVGTSFTDADVLGPGAGVRLGYATESDVYVGFLGLAHFGTHDEGEPTVRHYSESLRLELGYAIEIFPL